jgi:hypothetical protein
MCKPIEFHGFACCVSIQHYVLNPLHQDNPRIALILEDPEDGERIEVATINIPEEFLSKNEVIIKDYSENEGMLDTLMKAGIISGPKRYVESGYIKAPICELLIPGI